MAHFTAIAPAIVVRPLCSKCGARMWLTRIEPDKPGCNRRLFECSRCEHGMAEVVEFEKVAQLASRSVNPRHGLQSP